MTTKPTAEQVRTARGPVGKIAPGRDAMRTRRRGSRRQLRRWWLRVALLLALGGYVKFVGFDSKFYYPNQQIYLRPAELGLTCEDVYFETTDGVRLHGWLLPADTNAPLGTVIHFHGNAANVSGHIALVSWLPAAGYNVLMFDYRGYGASEGAVTRNGTIRDGHAAVDYCLSRPELRSGPIVAYGQSLGGAVATVVVAERPQVQALVIESSFSSYQRIAALHAQSLVFSGWMGRTLARALVSRGQEPIDFIARVAPRPVLIIAAENDSICFRSLARELYEAAGEPKSWWEAPGSQHLEILQDHPDELKRRILACFKAAQSTN